MNASHRPDRRQRLIWAVFAFFVALPSIALALAGLRAIEADDIQRAQAASRRTEFVGRECEDELRVAIAAVHDVGASTAAVPGVTIFQREPGGALSFPQHRVYVADVGVLPASLSSATPGRDAPGDIPAPIVTATGSRSQSAMQDALAQLRTGTWWLHLEQRRAYDRELVRRLIASGATDADHEDRSLDQLEQVQTILASAPGTGTPDRALDIQTPDGVALIAWSPTGIAGHSSRGAVLNATAMASLVDRAVRHHIASAEYAAEIRNSRGQVVWRLNDSGLPNDSGVRPILAVDGWQLRLSPAKTANRSAWVYGLVALPIALLALGLVMTSRVVRREVALARRQAEFTAAVTHEFKSPITSLRLLMERIASGRVTGGQALVEYHDAITREINRLDALVNRVLDAQQIQAGRRSHSPVRTAIAPILAASVDRFRPQALAKQIDLQTIVTPGSIELSLDRNIVSDALDNLIDNAIKYSPPGTAVSISAETSSGTLALSVRDQGAGIHRSDLPHVFEPYYRGKLGDRENVRGTGLGLALVQAAAIAHGGRVDVASEPGKGSTFTMRLPLGDPS